MSQGACWLEGPRGVVHWSRSTITAQALNTSRIWLAVSLALVILAVVAARQVDSNVLSSFSVRFLGIFIEAVPFLLLGTIVSGFISSFIKPAHVARLAPRNPLAGAAAGSLLGFVFPVCECGVVPVVRRLLTKGMPMSIGIAFLLAAPVVNIVVLFSTAAAFGFGTVLAARFIITICVAIAVGLVFSVQTRRSEVLLAVPSPAIAGGAVEVAGDRTSWKSGVTNSLELAISEFFSIGKFLVIGCLLAAGIQTLASQDLVLSIGQGPVGSVLAMQALGFVLSVCSTVDAFLALAFVGTFTTGSILAFLTLGPMLDIKSVTMFLGIFRARVVAYLVLLPVLMTMLVAIFYNLNVAA